MAAQNIYDDPDFLAGYATLDRQVRGFAGAPEWPDLRSLLPDLAGRRVVDLGCGFGWFSRWAAQQGASSVIGIDISTKMLERARSDNGASRIEYRCADLDEVELPAASIDIAFSSLTLHYVSDLRRLLSMLVNSLSPGGSLIFSIEHPIYSAPTTQQIVTGGAGDRYWPLNNYLVEGERVTRWFVDGVRKQHRTVATYVNSLVAAGLVIDRLVEWGPSEQAIEADPALADDRHRPWFLLLRASKPVAQ